MDFATFLWTTFAVFVTLAIFSFLYKDNPFYKFAEHLVVGVSAGYFVVILWFNGLVPNLFKKLGDGDWYYLWLNASEFWYIVPGILGVMMWTRFSKTYGWISRWPMALYIGIATGLAIPLEMSNRVNKQLAATMVDIRWSEFFMREGSVLDIGTGLSQVIIFVGALSALIYFFFSKEHKGLLGSVATFGIWILMIGFGASFGFTVMARVSLFIQRIQFVDQDWIQTAFDTTNQNHHSGFQWIFWAFLLFVIAYIAREIIQWATSDKTKNETPA